MNVCFIGFSFYFLSLTDANHRNPVMNRLRKITPYCCIALFSLSVAGCGGSSDPAPSPDPVSIPSEDEVASPGTDEVNNPVTEIPDTNNPGTGDPMTTDIASAIVGAWLSECEAIAGGNISARQMFLFTDTQLIRDWHEYDGDSCSGVPRGESFPLSIDNYELGAEVLTSDATRAFEIDLTLQQLPETTYNPGFGNVTPIGLEVGDQRFTIVSFEDGKVLWQDREPTNADNRFTDFTNLVQLAPRPSLTEDTITAQDVYGIYKTTCRGSDDGSFVYNITLIDETNVERFQDHFFFNHLCIGEPDAISETPSTIEFGDSFTNIFGDALLSAVKTRQQQTILKGADLVTFDLKSPRAPRYEAFALVGDTLLQGDCVLRVDECKNSPEFAADLIDLEFNSSIRHVRTDSADPTPGTTDTSAVAGFWDGTVTYDDGSQDVFYLSITDNGLSTYYDYLGDTFDGGDDCYFIYTETLTYFGNNAYRYEGFVGDEPYNYVDESFIVDSNLTSVGETGSISTFTPYTGTTSFNECV